MSYKADDEVPSISFIHVGEVRPAYNRSIAEISLRPNANRPDDGYPVHVSATFGSDIVKLNAGDTEFDVIFEISQSEIMIRQSNTKLEFGSEFHEQNKVYKSVRRAEVTESSGTEKGIALSQEGLSATAKRTTNYALTESHEFLDTNYVHADLGHVKIGKRKAAHPLEGQVVRDYCGWFAEPRSVELSSGIRADLNVRESWVRMKDPKTESKSALGDLWGWVSKSNRKDHNLKKELFADLLCKLTFLRLQSSDRTQTATLHAAAIICTPTDGINLVPALQAEPMVVGIDEADLLEFLQCEPGAERQTMKSILQRKKIGRKPKRSFVPHSNVRSALRAYKYICSSDNKHRLKSKTELENELGRNEVKDLMAAGLANHKDQKIIPINPYPTLDVENAFKVHVVNKSTISNVRDLLVDNPSLSPTDIGAHVANLLERNWKPATCQSNGHRLRSWTAFAFGDLLLDERGLPFHLNLSELDEHGPKVGPPRFMNVENLSRISKMKARGMPIAQMARELKVAAETIRKWKRNNPEKWDEL